MVEIKMTKDLQIVLLCPIHKPSYLTMIHLAKKIKEMGKYEPLMILTETIINCANQCRKEKINVTNFLKWDNFYEDGFKKAGSISPSINMKFFSLHMMAKFVKNNADATIEYLEKLFHGKILHYSLWHVLRSMYEIIHILYNKKSIEKFLAQQNIIACYIYTDAMGGDFALFHNICKKYGIKIIIPACAYQVPEILCQKRSKHDYFFCNNNAPYINQLIGKFMPLQTYEYKGERLLCYLAYEVLAWKILGCLPKNPWITGGSYADIVCAEDIFIKNFKEKHGLKNVVLLPHVELDQLKKYSDEFKLIEKICNPNRTVCYALPNLFYDGYLGWEDSLNEIQKVVNILEQFTDKLLLVLHPKMTFEYYVFLEKEDKIEIFNGPTSRAISLSGIYVCAGSSTISWAIMNESITIDMNNCYVENDLQFDLFPHLKSLITIYSLNELTVEMKKLGEDQKFKIVKKQVIDDKNKWLPPLDGKASERLVTLLDS